MQKIKILLCGALGTMGQNVIQCVKGQDKFEISCGFDLNECDNHGFKIYSDFDAVTEEIDVAIDFSHCSVTDKITDWCVKNQKPLVSAITGLSSESEDKIKEAAKYIPIFRSSNFSYGVSVMKKLAEQAAELLGSDFDIELTETHHNKKADAPSGTAKMLLAAVESKLPYAAEEKYGRNPQNGKREKNEIGVHSVRGGGICGEHELLFISDEEVVSIKHTALNKAVFAKGSLKAAEYILQKENGCYDMEGMTNEK